MAPHLEIWKPTGPELVALDSTRITVGKAKANDVAIPSDASLSRMHAVLEEYAAGWAVRDLGSRNGTYVNGERVWGERSLRPGDEIRLGKTRVVFRSESPATAGTMTEHTQAPPELTRREREVLVSLCRPVLSADVFTEPASIREIAKELVVTEGAVKQHLLRLYDKFGIHDVGERRRLALANEAVRRSAVKLTDLRQQ